MKLLVSEVDFLTKIPESPGVYRFYAEIESLSDITNLMDGSLSRDEGGSAQPLYIGKAINLQKRVKSYFQKSTSLSPRISLMVKKIHRIEITVTDNETSALILENNLIKSLSPKYNIIFRDDKTYPLIRISQDKFPKIDSYRGKAALGTRYFGPYPNVYAMRHTLDLLQRLFKLRTCTNAMFNNRSRPCMLYQIKRCSAPCVNLITQKEYQTQINLAIEFLHGNYKKIITELSNTMQEAASSEDFELAAIIRDEIGLIKSMTNKQIINDYKHPLNADLIVAKEMEERVFVYLIMVRGGIYVGDNHFILDNPDDDLTDVLRIFIENYYFVDITKNSLPAQSNVFEVYTKINIGFEIKNVWKNKIKIKNKLTQALNKLHVMGEDNLERVIAKNFNFSKLSESTKELSDILGLDPIKRIECIDISHNQGQNTVASLVVCESGDMNSSAYRRYNLSVDARGNKINGNDLLAFEIVLTRRLENTVTTLPDVILVDGGEGQLNMAKSILDKYQLGDKITTIAIKKGEKRNPMLDSLVLPNRRIIRAVDNTLLFKLLHTLRDEAHRFAITGHRKKEVKRMSGSELDEIPNIGTKKKQALIAHFGGSKNVAHASLNDLEKVDGIGVILAAQIYEYFHGTKKL